MEKFVTFLVTPSLSRNVVAGFGGLVGKPADSTEKKEEEKAEEEETPPQPEKVTTYQHADRHADRHKIMQACRHTDI